MNHKGTVTLDTQRLILRQFKMEDADAMFHNWANKSLVNRLARLALLSSAMILKWFT